MGNFIGIPLLKNYRCSSAALLKRLHQTKKNILMSKGMEFIGKMGKWTIIGAIVLGVLYVYAEALRHCC